MGLLKVIIATFPNLVDYHDKVLMAHSLENPLTKKNKIEYFKINKMNVILIAKKVVHIISMAVINKLWVKSWGKTLELI